MSDKLKTDFPPGKMKINYSQDRQTHRLRKQREIGFQNNTAGCTDRQTDIHTDRETFRQKQRQTITDRRTYRHTNIHTYTHAKMRYKHT